MLTSQGERLILILGFIDDAMKLPHELTGRGIAQVPLEVWRPSDHTRSLRHLYGGIAESRPLRVGDGARSRRKFAV